VVTSIDQLLMSIKLPVGEAQKYRIKDHVRAQIDWRDWIGLILLWYLQSPRSDCTLGKEKSLYVFLVEKTINGPAILGMNRGSSKSLNFSFFSKRQSWSNLGSSMHAVRACILPILILVHACIFHSKFLAHTNLNTYTLTSLEKLS
jgi:hypothetical protein